MKYIVWIQNQKWTIIADNEEIAILAIYSWLRTNARVEFYEWSSNDIPERFRNINDLKEFTPAKQKVYVSFMKKNKDKIIEAIWTITDLEKEIIDSTQEILQKYVDWIELEPSKQFEYLLDQITKLKDVKDTSPKIPEVSDNVRASMSRTEDDSQFIQD